MSDIDAAKIKRLDGSLLLVFVELVRHGRTTVVAKRLGLSQSAISHALARLRDLFDDPLFVRRADGLRPTRYALELAPRVEQILRLAQDTIGMAERFDPATTQRHFRLGAADYVCTLTAAALLRRFEEHAPQARFSFQLALGREAIDALKRDEVDVALGRFPWRLQSYRVEPLFDEEYCVIARHGHPRAGEGLDLATYLELGHVLTSVSGELVGLTDPELRKLGITRKVVASVPRFLITLSLVAESDAIAIVPRRLAQRHAQAFGLRVLPVPFALEPFAVVAVSRKRADPGIDWLLEQLRASV